MKPYDALLVLSFGGPEKPEDVVPFLENVTRGRGIPRERLEQVGEHYFLFGGRSPINDQNRALIAALEKDFADQGIDLPVYFGNRNWDPYLADTLATMKDDGVTRAAVFATSAYSSWSSCRQYRENLFDAVEQVPGAPRLDKLRQYYNHPGFIEPAVDAFLAALAELPDGGDRARLVFVTHSIPTEMGESSGSEDPAGQPRPAYVRQHRSAADEVARRVKEVTGRGHRHDLVYCSRSGAPSTPWLEPDVNDHLEELATRRRVRRGAGADRVRVRPHGGHLRPRHRGDGHRGAARHPGGARRTRPAPTRASWRWCASWSSSARPPSAASSPRGRPWARCRPDRTSAASAAAPTRADRARPCAVRDS